MTTQKIAQAIKTKKPAIIREKGIPRYVVLDWAAYEELQELKEDLEDHLRFEAAERASKGNPRLSVNEVKVRYGLQ